jgi:hypothetical protein
MLDRTIPENPPAFPESVAVDHMDGLNFSRNKGMTLRDYFAGQALVSLANDLSMDVEETCDACYGIADAMLAARAKGGW